MIERYQKAKHSLDSGELSVVYDRWTTKLTLSWQPLLEAANLRSIKNENKEIGEDDKSVLSQSKTIPSFPVLETYMFLGFKHKKFELAGTQYHLKAYWFILWGSRLNKGEKVQIFELLPRRRAKSKALACYFSVLLAARLGYLFYIP